MDKANDIVSNLNKLTYTKLMIFEQILQITKEQKENLEKNEGADMQELLDKKQELIDRVNGIDLAFEKQMKLLKDELNIKSLEEADFSKFPQLKDLKKNVSSIIDKAQEIMELENNNNNRMKQILENVKNELKKINAGKRSLNAYEKPGINTDGIFIDKKVGK